MSSYLLLRNPSANRVYAGEAAALTAAELEITAPFVSGIAQAEVAGVDYLAFKAEHMGLEELAGICCPVGPSTRRRTPAASSTSRSG